MQSNPNTEPMKPRGAGDIHLNATRFATNHNWCYRGDNTKPKVKK